MTDFEKWKDRYDKHWCTKEQLQMLVTLGVLTTNYAQQAAQKWAALILV